MQFSLRTENLSSELTAGSGFVSLSDQEIPTAPDKKAAGPENQAPPEGFSNA